MIPKYLRTLWSTFLGEREESEEARDAPERKTAGAEKEKQRKRRSNSLLFLLASCYY